MKLLQMVDQIKFSEKINLHVHIRNGLRIATSDPQIGFFETHLLMSDVKKVLGPEIRSIRLKRSIIETLNELL